MDILQTWKHKNTIKFNGGFVKLIIQYKKLGGVTVRRVQPCVMWFLYIWDKINLYPM